MLIETLSQLIEKTGADLGYDIYESSVQLKGENTKIRVTIDGPQPISHHDCETFSKELTGRLDESRLLPNYSLEVSSPGFKRKIKNFGHFKRFIGAPVKIIYENDAVRSVVKGTIRAVFDDALVVATEQQEVQISFSIIIQANLDY